MKHEAYARKRLALLCAVLPLLWLALAPLKTRPALASPPAEAQRQASLADVEQFFDDTVPRQLADQHVAGATIALVVDGQIMLARGYGEANVEKNVSVDPEATLFRIASLTKLFTWTAVMQLVEQGRLDLDADVNNYLDFKIPATYAEPVTMRHLPSHSAGFEERTLGIFVPSPQHLQPLQTWLPVNLPARVRPPGSVSSYSNYGAALAGYIVERVSGMSYEAYVETHILHPLGMLHSSARQPLPGELAAGLATGYAYRDGAFVAQPLDVLQTAPAGAISATATDMAAFMIAHLQNGLYQQTRILAEESAQQMHSTLFRHDSRLRSGYAYGFEERVWQGQTILSHSGDFQHFRSRLELLPAHNVGLFVAYNGSMQGNLPGLLVEAFFQRFYPGASQSQSPAGNFERSAAREVAGLYQSNRHAYATAEKMLQLVQPVFSIVAEGDELVLTNPYSGEVQRYIEIEPLLFRQIGEDALLAFREDGNGAIELVFIESMPAIALEKLAWYETPLFSQLLLGLTLLLFLSAPLVAFLALLRRRRTGAPQGSLIQPRLARIASWTILAVCTLSWLFLLLTGLATSRLITSLGADALALQLLGGLVALPWLIAFLAIASLALLAPVWLRRYWQLRERVYYSFLVGVSLAFTWFLTFWKLLGSA